MRIDFASDVKVGDTVYDCFMQPFVVVYKIGHSVDTYPAHTYTRFIVRDTSGKEHEYSSEDLYLSDLEGECDEEKSWVEWAKDNKDFFDEFDHLSTIKEIYKVGFGKGFDHRRKLTFEEMMQK